MSDLGPLFLLFVTVDKIFSSKFLRTLYCLILSTMGYVVIKLRIEKCNMMFAVHCKFNTTHRFLIQATVNAVT